MKCVLKEEKISQDTQLKHVQQRTMLAGALAHITHDGFSDMLYVFFPVWQVVLGLNFAEVGFLKTLFSGTMAFFQVPSGFLANRIGEIKLLLMGTTLTSLAVLLYGWGTTTFVLGGLLIIGGLGSSVQHPLSSSLISNVYQKNEKRRKALSIYNVSGDVGKLLIPGAVTFLIIQFDWSTACSVMGIFGLFVVVILFFLTKNLPLEKKAAKDCFSVEKKGHRIFQWEGNQAFWSLSTIGVIDSATRMGFLTFFPFLLRDKGADMGTVAMALTLIFAGGAIGKLVCGLLSNRFGVLKTVIITEISTGLCVYGMLAFSVDSSLLLSPILGIALNGTSSVLYGSVPELVSEEQRKQAFAIFYTATIGSGAVAPFIYGLVSDSVGIVTTIIIISVAVLITLPLTIPLKGRLVH